jgi:hypothetical protein
MTLSITTISMMTLNAYGECHYTECHYAECCYTECRGALFVRLLLMELMLALALFVGDLTGRCPHSYSPYL